jgi:hypothetical protein
MAAATDLLTRKPGLNCEKNALVCEGYHEKQIWKSGKERAEEGRFSLTPQPWVGWAFGRRL